MSSMYDRLRHRPVIAVTAVAGLVLAAAACSSNAASSNGAAGSGGKVTISIDCAPPAAQQPVQHKEWLEDVAIFEKANPNDHHRQRLQLPVRRGTGDVHRDAARRDRDEPLLHLFH